MVDRYTKAVLTVIAGCLLWLCVMSVGRPVEAQRLAAPPPDLVASHAQPVVIVGWGEMSTKGGGVVLSLKRQPDGTQVTDPALPVRLPYSPQNPMPVAFDRNGSPLPVTVNSAIKLAYTSEAPLPIGVTAIKRTVDWDSIDTNVLPGPRTKLPGELQE
jgi:hypothetical protein